jgi:hypothetical protein
MAKFLFDVEQKNRLEQKGLLKRFSLNCYGKQPSMEDLRSEKAKMYKELINKKDSKEYKEWFLKYNPNSKSDVKSSKTFKPIKGKKNRTRKQRVKSAFLF